MIDVKAMMIDIGTDIMNVFEQYTGNIIGIALGTLAVTATIIYIKRK